MALPIKRKQELDKWREPWTGMTSLQREMNRLFDDMLTGWGLEPFRTMGGKLAAYQPTIEVSETDQSVKVTAELPGMDEKDVNVTLDEDALIISGEKKEEKKEENEESRMQETVYGAFQRVIPLDSKINLEKVSASFKRGVLKITLPKIPGSPPPKGRKIEIKPE